MRAGKSQSRSVRASPFSFEYPTPLSNQHRLSPAPFAGPAELSFVNAGSGWNRLSDVAFAAATRGSCQPPRCSWPRCVYLRASAHQTSALDNANLRSLSGANWPHSTAIASGGRWRPSIDFSGPARPRLEAVGAARWFSFNRARWFDGAASNCATHWSHFKRVDGTIVRWRREQWRTFWARLPTATNSLVSCLADSLTIAGPSPWCSHSCLPRRYSCRRPAGVVNP